MLEMSLMTSTSTSTCVRVAKEIKRRIFLSRNEYMFLNYVLELKAMKTFKNIIDHIVSTNAFYEICNIFRYLAKLYR